MIYLSDDVPSFSGLVSEIDPRDHFYDRDATSFNLSKLLYTIDYFSFKLCIAKMKDALPVVEDPEGECKKDNYAKVDSASTFRKMWENAMDMKNRRIVAIDQYFEKPEGRGTLRATLQAIPKIFRFMKSLFLEVKKSNLQFDHRLNPNEEGYNTQ